MNPKQFAKVLAITGVVFGIVGCTPDATIFSPTETATATLTAIPPTATSTTTPTNTPTVTPVPTIDPADIAAKLGLSGDRAYKVDGDLLVDEYDFVGAQKVGGEWKLADEDLRFSRVMVKFDEKMTKFGAKNDMHITALMPLGYEVVIIYGIYSGDYEMRTMPSPYESGKDLAYRIIRIIYVNIVDGKKNYAWIPWTSADLPGESTVGIYNGIGSGDTSGTYDEIVALLKPGMPLWVTVMMGYPSGRPILHCNNQVNVCNGDRILSYDVVMKDQNNLARYQVWTNAIRKKMTSDNLPQEVVLPTYGFVILYGKFLEEPNPLEQPDPSEVPNP